MLESNFLSFYCNCKKSKEQKGVGGCINFKENKINWCTYCNTKYYLDTKPVPNGTAFYVYHKEDEQ